MTNDPKSESYDAASARIAMAQLEAHADTDRAPSVDDVAARVRARLPASPYAKPEYDALTDRVIYGVGLGSLTRAELVRIAWACLDQAGEIGLGRVSMHALLGEVGGFDDCE